jgi:membrane-bound lytic murein transglycosylase
MLLGRIATVLACFAVAVASMPLTNTASAQPGQAAVGSEGVQPATAEPPSLTPFWTKYAYFVPSRFSDLPGWRDDSLAEAWKAFRASCAVLANRAAWVGPCARSIAVNARNDDDVRRYLEREFALYEIHNKDQSPAGVITGYYEPLLRGSRRYGAPYLYPVYGVPEDLLYVDSRSIPRTLFGAQVFARVEGRTVIPACTGFAASASCREPYTLDLADSKPDIRDKKLRVRIEGQRIVPYYTRAQIDQGVLAVERVIVWVDDRAALYSMQVQGSGTPLLWTHLRYSPEVVASMVSALRRFLTLHPSRRVVLIGYSGGGTLAWLMAGQVSETAAIVTVAANLDRRLDAHPRLQPARRLAQSRADATASANHRPASLRRRPRSQRAALGRAVVRASASRGSSHRACRFRSRVLLERAMAETSGRSAKDSA